MFKKKNKDQFFDYSKWADDFGFLTLLLSRKKNITKNYFLSLYSSQKQINDALKDSEVESIISKTVSEAMTEIGANYKKFLITKYFGEETNLISYITEDVYVDLTSYAINLNRDKIRDGLQTKIIKKVGAMNRTPQNKK